MFFLVLNFNNFLLGSNDFMAEEINAGVAVFVADRGLSMCGLGSDGIAALLSACSLVCCCSHQFIFPS